MSSKPRVKPYLAKSADRNFSESLPVSNKSIQRLCSRFGVLLAGCDILGLFLAGFAAYAATVFIEKVLFNTSSSLDATSPIPHLHTHLYLSMIALVMLWSNGMYRQRLPWWTQVKFIGKTILTVFLVDGFVSFATQSHEARLLVGLNWLFALGFILSFRFAVHRMALKSTWWKIPTIIIGDNVTATELLHAFTSDPFVGYDVHSVLLRDRNYQILDLSGLPLTSRNVKIYGDTVDYGTYIRKNPHNFYVLSLGAFRNEIRDSLINTLKEVGATYAIVPAITNIGCYDMKPHYFWGHEIMMLQTRTPSTLTSAVSKAAKRGMDVVISGIALTALLPLFAVVAAMLKIEGQGGSIFYDGRRIGYQGKFFKCWKFRSMEPNSDHLLQAYLDAHPLAKANWEKYRKLPNDPRITTRTARLIRKFSIDELPQLWNVFTGDMSLVGPRPILEDETHYFGDKINEYQSVRPGLTGLWQVSGRNSASFMRRVYWDSWYVRNWSLWTDFIILIKTPLVMLSSRGAH